MRTVTISNLSNGFYRVEFGTYDYSCFTGETPTETRKTLAAVDMPALTQAVTERIAVYLDWGTLYE